MPRCAWAGSDPLLTEYHDSEWGVPQRDGRALWEMLVLEGFQAGLSWTIILRKRDAFRAAFHGFRPEAVARYGPRDVARLLRDPRIVRSRAKIVATIDGARAYLAMRDAGIDFAEFVWGLAGGAPHRFEGPARTKSPLSGKISAVLKSRGFKFVGPVIVYAWLQAVGIENGHSRGCFRREEVAVDGPPRVPRIDRAAAPPRRRGRSDRT